MKRSEMVAKIVGYLLNQERMMNIKLNTNKTKLTEFMLDCFEREGMLPPFNNYDFHMDGDKADEKSITYRTWELEDE